MSRFTQIFGAGFQLQPLVGRVCLNLHLICVVGAIAYALSCSESDGAAEYEVVALFMRDGARKILIVPIRNISSVQIK